MESRSDTPPLITIVGETASGKSALALTIATLFNGEIIAADSRTVYRGLDIGTAKPTLQEQRHVPHHLLDVVEPSQIYTVADFQIAAHKAVADIAGRGKLPLLVGGSGLYVDAVLYNFGFREKSDRRLRTSLQKLSVEELQARLMERGIPLPENRRNPRHLVRAIETGGVPAEKSHLRSNTLIIGLQVDREVLRAKITRRVDLMVEQGFVEEVKRVSKQYGWEAPALQAPGYKAFRYYINGTISIEEAKELFIRGDMQLAKRQRTWFKRNKDIHWIKSEEKAVDLVTTFLNK